MAAPSQPAGRRMRSKSAKARLTTTKIDLDEGMLSHRPDFNKSKRAQSAMGNKARAERSKFVLPGFKQEDNLGTTHYEEEFEKKKGDMAAVRPSSPTRRNNPHPSEEFMQWKVSSRVLESSQGLPQTQDASMATGLQERFYADYSGGNDGDMKTGVPITNVATIKFPGRPQHPQQTARLNGSGLSGTRIQLNPRSSASASKHRLVGATAKTDSTAELLEEWLQEGAKEDEKTVVLQMLKTAATDDVRLKKALHTTLSPAAMPGVEQWLQGASEDERKTVANVFEQLATRKRQPRAEGSTGHMPPISQSMYSVGRPGHSRRASDPLPVARINPPPMLYRHAMQRFQQSRQTTGGATRAASRALGSRPNSSLRRSQSHHSDNCQDCETSRVEGAFSRLEMGSDGTRQQQKQAPLTPMPAMMWHMYSKRDPTPNVTHRGSIFSLPDKYRGTHFDLTPEWPTV
eukprot:scpid25115/ scgid18200/ 